MGNSWDRKTFEFVFSKQARKKPVSVGQIPLPPEGQPAFGDGKILYIFLIKHYIFINVQLVHCILRVGGGWLSPPPPRHPPCSSNVSCLAGWYCSVTDITLKNPELSAFN
jgi:hypothetical protein